MDKTTLFVMLLGGFVSLQAHFLLAGSFRVEDVHDVGGANPFADKQAQLADPTRPQLHFSAPVGWMNDPNGLSYRNGEYHIFYQHNEKGMTWGPPSWGHAVSTDLLHWRHLPEAIEPYDGGSIWSGSGFTDENNVLGCGEGAHVLYYTWANGKVHKQLAACSLDGVKFNRVNDAGFVSPTDCDRDPWVFYHKGCRKWVMLVHGEDQKGGCSNFFYRVYHSSDLRKWNEVNRLMGSVIGAPGYTWRAECPSMAELPVENEPGKTAWVLFGGGPYYDVGQFDGTNFNAEAEHLLAYEGGAEWYAGQIFHDVPGGRTLWTAWAKYNPPQGVTQKYSQGLAPIQELKLVRTAEGLRLRRFPIKEYEHLRQGTFKPFAEAKAELAEVMVAAVVKPGAKLKFSIRGIEFCYDGASGNLHFGGKWQVHWPSEAGKISLRMFVDRVGIDVFDGQGRTALPITWLRPEATNREYRLIASDGVTQLQMSVCPLSSIHETPGKFTLKPMRYGANWDKDEPMLWRYRLYPGPGENRNALLEWNVTDAHGREWGRGSLPNDIRDGGEQVLMLTAKDIRNRFGAMKVQLTAKSSSGEVSVESWFTRQTSPNPEPVGWIGTNDTSFPGWWDGDYRDIDLMGVAGIGVVRTGIWWPRYEKEKGVYTPFDRVDAYFSQLAARGIRNNCILSGDYRQFYDDPIDPEAFCRFGKWLAKYHDGRIDRYEIWNEPGNFGWPQAYGEEKIWYPKFLSFTHRLSDALIAGNPKVTVAVASEDREYFLKREIADGIARSHETFSFHPYCHLQARPEREYFFKDGGREIKELLKANGGCTNLVITEAGWTTVQGNVAFYERVGCYPKVDYAMQAQYMVRMYLLARIYGCEYACQFGFRDRGPRRNYTEHNFGMVREDGTPKAAFGATAFLARLLGKATPQGEISGDPDRMRVCQFRRNGETVLAVWAVEQPITYDFPRGFGSVVKAFDLQGNEIPELTGKTNLLLTEEPVYLVFNNK